MKTQNTPMVATDTEKAVERQLNSLLNEAKAWKPSNVLAEARYSKKTQEEGSSEVRQMMEISEAVKDLGWPEPKWLILRGVSAWKRDKETGTALIYSKGNPLGDFFEDVKLKRVPKDTVVVCANADRFSRQPVDDADGALMFLLRNDVSVFVVNLNMLLRPGDQHDVIKRLILMLEFHRAHCESERKSHLSAQGFKIMRKQAAEGKVIRWGSQAPSWVRWDNDTEKYVAIPEKWAVVRRIITDILAGVIPTKVARQLNAEKVPMLSSSPTAQPKWDYCSVAQVMTSVALIGCSRSGVNRKKGTPNFGKPAEIFENQYPAVCSQEEWKLLQARFAMKQPRGGGARESSNITSLFPGRVVCAKCGHTMKAHTGTFHCKGRAYGTTKTGEHCSTKNILHTSTLEIDLFYGLLSKSPEELLTRKDAVRQGLIAGLTTEIADLSAEYNYLNRSAAKRRTEQAEKDAEMAFTKLTEKQVALQKIHAEYSTTAGVQAAYHEIKALLAKESLTDQDFIVNSQTRDALLKQLGDRDTRDKLVGWLKGLVCKVELKVDERSKAYRVEFVGGTMSEWRDVTMLEQAVVATKSFRFISPEHKRKIGEAVRKRYALMTPEQKAAIYKKVGDKCREHKRSPEVRQLMSERMKLVRSQKTWTSPGMQGHHHSAEAKTKISEGLKHSYELGGR